MSCNGQADAGDRMSSGLAVRSQDWTLECEDPGRTTSSRIRWWWWWWGGLSEILGGDNPPRRPGFSRSQAQPSLSSPDQSGAAASPDTEGQVPPWCQLPFPGLGRLAISVGGTRCCPLWGSGGEACEALPSLLGWWFGSPCGVTEVARAAVRATREKAPKPQAWC